MVWKLICEVGASLPCSAPGAGDDFKTGGPRALFTPSPDAAWPVLGEQEPRG